jgi:hypothetical protein
MVESVTQVIVDLAGSGLADPEHDTDAAPLGGKLATLTPALVSSGWHAPVDVSPHAVSGHSVMLPREEVAGLCVV